MVTSQATGSGLHRKFRVLLTGYTGILIHKIYLVEQNKALLLYQTVTNSDEQSYIHRTG
jgi:ribosome biogenesis protein Nip4